MDKGSVIDAPAMARDMFVPISELAPRIGEHITLEGDTIHRELSAIEQQTLEDIAAGAAAQTLRRMAIDNGGRPRLTRVK